MPTPTQRPPRDLLKLALLCVLLLALALAAGCASNSKDDPSQETNGAAPPASSVDSPETASSISEEEASEVAEKVLLTPRDFPAGWSQLPAEEDEDPPLDLPPECQAFAGEVEWPGTLVEIDSPEFEGPDRETVGSSAIVFVDADAARQAFADYKAVFDLCREPVRAALTTYYDGLLRAEHPDTNVAVTALSLDWLPFPQYGDESVAARLSATFVVGTETTEAYTDMFGWRVGRIEGDMGFTDCFEPPDQDEEQRLAQIMDERLRDAAEDLD